MRDALFTVLATVLTVFIVGIGLFMMTYFFQSKIGVLPFLIGLIGYFISLRPAISEWEKTFKTWFKVED